MKKTLKSFLSMSLIVAIVSTLLMPTQAQAKTKSLVADKDKVNVLDAIEAFENSGLDQILQPVSVGQTSHLCFVYDGEIVKPSKVKWKVTEGKDIVKIVKKGKLYKGLKEGEAVIEGTYKGTTLKFGVTVYKKTTVKAQKLKFDDISIKIPKNYLMFADLGGGSATYINTKNEIALAIQVSDMPVSADDITEDVWAYMDPSMAESILSIDISSFGLDSFGYAIDNEKTEREAICSDHGVYAFKFKCPMKNYDDMFLGIVVLYKKDKLFTIINISFDEDLSDQELDYILNNNK